MKDIAVHEFYEPAMVTDTWTADLSAVDVVAPGVVRLSFTALQRTGMKNEAPMRIIVCRLVLAVPTIAAIAATLVEAIDGEVDVMTAEPEPARSIAASPGLRLVSRSAPD